MKGHGSMHGIEVYEWKTKIIGAMHLEEYMHKLQTEIFVGKR